MAEGNRRQPYRHLRLYGNQALTTDAPLAQKYCFSGGRAKIRSYKLNLCKVKLLTTKMNKIM